MIENLIATMKRKALGTSARVLEERLDGIKVIWPARERPLLAIASISIEDDNRMWVHVSVSVQKGLEPCEDRLPSPMELNHVKECLLGDVEAYTVLPIRAKKVNIHPGCLHFFYCLMVHSVTEATRPGAVLPDFTKGSGSL